MIVVVVVVDVVVGTVLFVLIALQRIETRKRGLPAYKMHATFSCFFFR